MSERDDEFEGGSGGGGRRRLHDGLQWLLNLSSDVRRDEVFVTLLFLVNIFVVLVAYYIIKTVREPLILTGGGAEMKSYAAAVQAAVLFGYIPLYGWFASRFARMPLNAGLVLFFLGCIQVFFGFGYFGAPNVFGQLGGDGVFGWLAANITLGFVFYIWVGIFSLSLIAQFWSYANDVFDADSGKRLFPVIAIGATAGAPIGSGLAAWLFETTGMGPYAMLQVSAGLLVVHLGLYWWAERRYCARLRQMQQDGSAEAGKESEEAEDEEAADEGEGGFQLILKNNYLMWLALFFILLNLVNTTGEYILSTFAIEGATGATAQNTAAFVAQSARQVAEGASAAAPSGLEVVEAGSWTGSFYGRFFSVVNVVTVLIQAFLVSRLLKYLGMAGIIFALPVVALGTYSMAAAGAGLAIFRWVKTAENSTDYSIMNTGRALVWLPTTRAEQYVAKQTVDTFFVRFGDVLSAGLVFVGTTWLQFSRQDFAITNLVLIACWIGVGLLVYRGFRRLSEKRGVTEDDIREEVR